MVENYNKKKEEIERSDNPLEEKEEQLERIKSETTKEIKLRLEANPLEQKAAIEIGYAYSKKVV